MRMRARPRVHRSKPHGHCLQTARTPSLAGPAAAPLAPHATRSPPLAGGQGPLAARYGPRTTRRGRERRRHAMRAGACRWHSEGDSRGVTWQPRAAAHLQQERDPAHRLPSRVLKQHRELLEGALKQGLLRWPERDQCGGSSGWLLHLVASWL